MSTMQKIVARVSSRVLVGVPTCEFSSTRVGDVYSPSNACMLGRNEEYLDMSILFTRDVNNDRLVMNRFPRILKP